MQNLTHLDLLLQERRQEAAVPRLLVHLPQVRPPANQGRRSPDLPSGADERVVCNR